jgi:glycine betaine/choline ABC-type transport system substrate-binding protein
MNRILVLGASMVALGLVTTSCGSSGGTSSSSPTQIASQMTLGGPAECPTRPFCQAGLVRVYGLHFKAFKPLDAGGPLTKAALDGGAIDLGLILSSDSAYSTGKYVQLADDKHLQNADNVVPLIKTSKATADVTALLNEIDGKLTTQDLIALNKSSDVDKQDPDVIAKKWLTDHSYGTSASGASKGTITVGALNFPESAILAQIYGQALKGKGYTINFKLNLGSREIVEPALEKGDIDLFPDYAATELEFQNKAKGEATPDATATVAKLNTYLDPKGLKALDPSPAVDQNAFAVLKSGKYGKYTKLSDLAGNA